MAHFRLLTNLTFEDILRRRDSVPPPSSNLTTRIMERTLRVQRVSGRWPLLNLMQLLQELLCVSIRLQTASVLVIVLIMGVVIGFMKIHTLWPNQRIASEHIMLADDGEML